MRCTLLVFLSLVSCSSPKAPVTSTEISRLSASECPCCPCDGGVVTDSGVPGDAAVVTPPVITSHPRIYVNAHKQRLLVSLTAKTPAATRWKTTVDRWLAGADLWGFQNWHGALASVLTGDAKYCAKAVENIDRYVRTADEAISGNKNPVVAGDSYLEVGDLIGDLAIVYDWCHANVSDSQKKRWIAYANQAVWNVWNFKQATWGDRSAPWTGWSVDNPSNNYHYSFLRATMLLGLATKGENDQADAWLTTFKTKMATLAATFQRDLAGGGSREGTGYGVAMRRLFELYAWWQASTGEALATKTFHTRASLLAMMHQIMPTRDRFAPIGDQSRDSTAMLFDYHRHYLLELAGLLPTDTLSGRARDLLAASSVKTMQNSFMLVYDFLLDNTGPIAPMDKLSTAYHATGIAGVYARSSWKRDATWFGLQAGPYTESHAHQDQGSILLYKNGWLVTDAVIYSKSGLPQDTLNHSMVRLESGGVPLKQIAKTLSTVTVLRSGAGWLFAGSDTTQAYNGHASVVRVQRDVMFLHDGVVIVYDRVRLGSNAQSVYQLVVPTAPTISGSTATSGRLVVHAQNAGWTTKALAGGDLTAGHRLDYKPTDNLLTVLNVDSAASNIVISGNVVNLVAGGKTHSIVFNKDAPGATYNGQVITGVTKLSE